MSNVLKQMGRGWEYIAPMAGLFGKWCWCSFGWMGGLLLCSTGHYWEAALWFVLWAASVLYIVGGEV